MIHWLNTNRRVFARVCCQQTKSVSTGEFHKVDEK